MVKIEQFQVLKIEQDKSKKIKLETDLIVVIRCPFRGI